MCLAYLDDTVERKFKNKGFGWKVFRETTEGLIGDARRGRPRTPNKWLHEAHFRRDRSQKTLKISSQKHYPTGWHIFLTRDGARRWQELWNSEVIRRVQFRKPVAWGKQRGYPTVVAKEMYIE